MGVPQFKPRAILLRGVRADQPAATAVAEGTLYAVTDEHLIERSTGAAWQVFLTGVSAVPIPWGSVSKTGSSLADLATRSAGDLSSGTLLDARFPVAGSWVVAWSATGVAPAIGNGSITGRFTRYGKLAFCTITLVAGSTTTFGSGAWFFSTPSTMLALATAQLAAGATATDSSVGTVYGGVARKQSTTGLFVYNILTNSIMGSSIPFTWAQTDVLTIQFWCEEA